MGDRDTAADVAQAALVRAFESAGGFRLQASYKTWLFAIAINLVRDHYRRGRTRREVLSSEMEDAAVSVQARGGRSVEASALDRMASRDLWGLVDGLNDDHRMAVLLRFRLGMTYDEIAAAMDTPPGTAKSWVHYGLRKLRKTLESSNCEG